MDIVTLALAKKYADSINSGITNITTENNKLIFTLQNGNTIEVPLTDLVNNVVTEEELLNKLKDYIKNTDFASAEKAGIIKVDATSYATELDNGKLKASTKTYENYKDMNNDGFIGKGTLENVIEGKNLETANNKVTFVDKNSTDVQYPSAKAMYKVSNKLDTLKDEVLDTGEASDSFIHIEDSAISELQELSIEGVCEQKTTNLLDMSDFEIGGMLKGIKNNMTNYRINNANKPIQVVPSGEYIIDVLDWGIFKGLRFGIHSCSEDGTFINDSNWIQLKNNVPYHVTIRDDTKKIKLIFSCSTTSEIVVTDSSENKDLYESAKDWLRGAKIEFKPIGGPNPNHPQEIKTITDSLKITSCNENLFDGLLELGIYNNSTGEKESSIVSIRSVNYIRVKPNTSYTVLEENNKSIYFHEYDKNKIFISTNALLNTPKTITTSANTNYLTINTRGSENVTDINIKIIIAEGTTVTSFEEHIQSQITANLPEGEFIGKIDDTYKDTLSVDLQDDGKYHLILNKMISKVILDGSENIILQETATSGKNRFNIAVNGVKDIGVSSVGIKSNKFIGVSRADTWVNITGIAVGNNVLQIYYEEYATKTVDDFKTWLSTHNTEVYYPLETPYIVDLGPIDMPLTYNEITNIFTDSNLLPQINAKYYRNFTKTIQNLQINNDTLKNELLSIENRLTALENANTTTTNTESTIESEGTK